MTFEAHFRADVSEMVPDARDEARAADLDAFPADLHVYCIDDSATARRLLEHNLRLRARTANVHLFGEYETDADAFVCAALTDGDVAILDQHLEYGGHSNILGTDIVRQLVVQGFKGLVCIRSGNVTPQVRGYTEAADPHVTIPTPFLPHHFNFRLYGRWRKFSPGEIWGLWQCSVRVRQWKL